MKTETDIFALSAHIRQTAFDLHLYLCHGHLEKVYENGLANRLRKSGLIAIQQHPLEVRDNDGTILGSYLADLFVENRILVELKACKTIAEEHVAQLLGYMRAAHIEHGILINFGSPIFQLKKFAMSDPN